MSIDRRDLLKLSASSLLLTILSPFASAQPVSGAPISSKGAQVDAKLDGTVTYNAGWVVPLEDRAPLLELEAKKNKEQEELKKNKVVEPVNSEQPKEKPKSFADKFQGFIGKVKSFF
jgi:hypothetical protein